MDYYLFVVEGTHDAAFFGRLLKERGFQKLDKKGAVVLPAKAVLHPTHQV